MTEYVHLPDSTFAHDRLHLAPPNGLQGGAYFSMLYYKDTPLYVQTPVCTSRQGVVPGKRPYIDLMFSNHDVSFLEWLETMEASAVRLIYEKRNIWISSDIERSDIEAGFTSPVRPYKGGKHYLIRAHIQPTKHLASASASCSVFDENERPVPLEYIKPEHQMYAVLEFQGIKFTARSFQIEVSLKQVLVVPNVPMFQSCVIRKPVPNNEQQQAHHVQSNTHEPQPMDAHEAQPMDAHEAQPMDAQPMDTNEAQPMDAQNMEAQPMEAQPMEAQPTDAHEEMEEIHVDGLDQLEHMHIKLKKPSEVYYNMYKRAKQKARELKKTAIAAYLEAKQIKSAHMLEDSSDEDSEEEQWDE